MNFMLMPHNTKAHEVAETPDNPSKEIKTIDLQAERKKKKPGRIDRVDLNAKIAEINQEFSVIQRGSQVLVMRHWLNEVGESKLAFFKRPDFLLFMENRRISVENEDGEKSLKPLGPLWLASPLRAQFDEVYFEPNGPESETRYNLWQGFGMKPQEGVGEFDIFLDHIKTNICSNNEELYTWVMGWLADLVQHPGRKPGTALILRGEMGIGKGQFAKHIGKLLGVHYMTVTQSSQVTGKFNGHMSDKILIFFDESFWTDNKQGAGVLRALITEDFITVEMKGRDAIMVQNFTRLIAAANNDWAVPVGFKDERRMAVLDVSSLCMSNFTYFKNMKAQLEKNSNSGYKALLYYLQHYEYEENLPRTIPVTEALLDQKKHSLPHYLKWWLHCLESRFIVKPEKSVDNWPIKISTNSFYNSYHSWCESLNIKDILADRWLTRKLGKWVWLKKERVKGDDTYYYLETIDEARMRFDVQIGHIVEWDDAFSGSEVAEAVSELF